MKKIMLVFAAAALVSLSACNDKSTTTEGQNTQEKTEAQEVTEIEVEVADVTAGDDTTKVTKRKIKVDPYIAKLMQSDSTIKVTPSGLGYKVIKQGEGPIPTKDNMATVIYTGKHKDGSVFDSSVGRGDGTAEFPLSGVVPGFSEGICLMPLGSHYILYLPSELGYGKTGTPGGPIGPDEFLIFEVELLDFK